MKKILSLLTALGVGISTVPIIVSCSTSTNQKVELTPRQELAKLIEEAQQLENKDKKFFLVLNDAMQDINDPKTPEKTIITRIEELKIEFTNYHHEGYREARNQLVEIIEKTKQQLEWAAGDINNPKPIDATRKLMGVLTEAINILIDEVEPYKLSYMTIILTTELDEFNNA